MFTQTDKIAKLQRLVNQIDKWDAERKLRSYGPVFRMGNPDLAIDSPKFQEWRGKVTATIVLIFGEHSHYVDDFNEISYTDILAMFSRVSGGPETRLWTGLAQAKRLLQAMIDEIKATEARPSFAAIKTLEETSAVNQWDRASFAVIVLTAEDVTASGEVRGRQNVIHEAGLCQGKLGFDRVVILKQEGVAEPSNLAGLQYISFPENRIEKAFYELQKVLKREGII